MMPKVSLVVASEFPFTARKVSRKLAAKIPFSGLKTLNHLYPKYLPQFGYRDNDSLSVYPDRQCLLIAHLIEVSQ